MEEPRSPQPIDPSDFADAGMRAVLAHSEHGGWYETDEGLRCAGDDELVIPSSGWLTER